MDNTPRLLRIPLRGSRRWGRHRRWGRGRSALVVDGGGRASRFALSSSITFYQTCCDTGWPGWEEIETCQMWAIKSGADSRAIGERGGGGGGGGAKPMPFVHKGSKKKEARKQEHEAQAQVAYYNLTAVYFSRGGRYCKSSRDQQETHAVGRKMGTTLWVWVWRRVWTYLGFNGRPSKLGC